MIFTGINIWAVLVATAAGFATGGIWYGVLGKPWMKAHGFTAPMKNASPLPYIVAVLADFVMAVFLSGLMWHLNAFTLRGGLISGAHAWFGFVITTLAVNNAFGMRSPKLILIDGGHWLAVLLVMGAIIGVWGL
ncbi:MAG TPA: DUF1761 domain-containing protein [Xanthobacteraceae bacterium]|jgi:hypothetical protein|nr:DUF1761 domain-containing protein [Xanthobacteraceae bacterium]